MLSGQSEFWRQRVVREDRAFVERLAKEAERDSMMSTGSSFNSTASSTASSASSRAPPSFLGFSTYTADLERSKPSALHEKLQKDAFERSGDISRFRQGAWTTSSGDYGRLARR